MSGFGRAQVLAALPVWLVAALGLGGGLLAQYAALAAAVEAVLGRRPGPLPFGTEDGAVGVATLGAVALAALYLTVVARRRYDRLRLPNVAALSPVGRAAVLLLGGAFGLLVGAVLGLPLHVLLGGGAGVAGIAAGLSGTLLALDALLGAAGDAEG
jgi:hypothetical protein